MTRGLRVASILAALALLGACSDAGPSTSTTAASTATAASGTGPGGSTSASSTGRPSAGSSATSGGASGSAAASTSGSTSGGVSTGGTSSGGAAEKSNLVAPATLDFGNVLINAQVQKTLTLTEMATVVATGIHSDVSGVDFSLFTVGKVPGSLDGGASAQVTVTYAPLSLESSSDATLEFTDADGSTASVNLTGVPVTNAVEIVPNPLDFGIVPLSSTTILCVTVTAVAGVPVTVQKLTAFVDAAGAFASSSVDAAMPANPAPIPVTIAAGDSAQVCFSFTPALGQTYDGQVTLVTDDPSGNNPIVFLTGQGAGT